MAIRNLSPCSSSGTINLSPSIPHYGTPFSTKSVNFSSRDNSCRWVSHILSEVRSRKLIQLKSSNGHPLNAVSFKDDLPGSPIAKEHTMPQVEGSLRIAESVREQPTLSITVVGASGDLAKKKIFPALFALFYEDCLPENFTVFGYARTEMTDEQLRNMISETLTCRIDKRENCDEKMKEFLKRCFYQSGQYNSEEDFSELNRKLKEKEVVRKQIEFKLISRKPEMGGIYVDLLHPWPLPIQ